MIFSPLPPTPICRCAQKHDITPCADSRALPARFCPLFYAIAATRRCSAAHRHARHADATDIFLALSRQMRGGAAQAMRACRATRCVKARFHATCFCHIRHAFFTPKYTPDITPASTRFRMVTDEDSSFARQPQRPRHQTPYAQRQRRHAIMTFFIVTFP